MSRLRDFTANAPESAAVAHHTAAIIATLVAAALVACTVPAFAAATQLTFHEGDCSTASPAPNATGTLVAFRAPATGPGRTPIATARSTKPMHKAW